MERREAERQTPEERLLYFGTTPGLDDSSRLSLIRSELRSLTAPRGGDLELTTAEPVLAEPLQTDEWSGEIMKKTRKRQGKEVEERLDSFSERHIIFGDAQIPDHDQQAIESLYKFMRDFKPTHLWLIGDMLNATTISRFGNPADYHISFWDEIRMARELLQQTARVAREANPNVKIAYTEGNHELRQSLRWG